MGICGRAVEEEDDDGSYMGECGWVWRGCWDFFEGRRDDVCGVVMNGGEG